MSDETRAFDPSDTPDEARITRAFDAVANRAAEAIRVLEDACRFVHDDRLLAAETKQIRHDLAAAITALDRSLSSGWSRRLARDVGADVGTNLVASGTLRRTTVSDIIEANAARAGQALRSLAEFAGLLEPETVDGAAAATFDRLRYRIYAVEAAAARLDASRDRLSGVDLCVLVPTGSDESDFVRLIESLFEAGVRMLQVRDHAVTAAVLFARAKVAAAVARRRGTVLVINDRPDVAVAAGADGAHVGETDLPTAAARRVLGPARLLGRTVHSLEELQRAVSMGADYLGAGPCFRSSTKNGLEPGDRAVLGTIASTTALPTFAIGGVTAERIEEVFRMGFSRVAVAAAVTEDSDPARAASELIKRLAFQSDSRRSSTTAAAIADSSLDR